MSRRQWLGVAGPRTLAILALVAGPAGAHGAPAGSTQIVAVSGETGLDSGATFVDFRENTRFNEAGQVLFSAALSGGRHGLFLGDGSSLDLVLKPHDPSPDGTSFLGWGDLELSDGGEVGFRALVESPGLFQHDGVFRWDGQNFELIARTDMPSPDGDGFLSWPFPADYGFCCTVLHERKTTFVAHVYDRLTSDPEFFQLASSFDRGLFRSDGGVLEKVLRTGDPAPGGDGTWSEIHPPYGNRAGQVAFGARITSESGSFGAIYVEDEKALVEVARSGRTQAWGSLRLPSHGLQLNDRGQVAFRATVVPPGPSEPYRTAFLADGSSLEPLLLAGVQVPGGDGTLLRVHGEDLNNAGHVALDASLSQAGQGSNARGIYLFDGLELAEVVRTMNLIGSSRFSELGLLGLNDRGQVAFSGRLDETPGGHADDEGLFLIDPVLGLLTIAREGDPLLGSSIASFGRFPLFEPPYQAGFNNRGQLVYLFTLADGREGIAIGSATSAPEAGAGALLALAVAALLLVRSGRTTHGPRMRGPGAGWACSGGGGSHVAAHGGLAAASADRSGRGTRRCHSAAAAGPP